MQVPSAKSLEEFIRMHVLLTLVKHNYRSGKILNDYSC